MRQLFDGQNLTIDTEVMKSTEFKVGELAFDNVGGIGSVPMMTNLHYMGVLVGMTPRIFLNLTPTLDVVNGRETIPFLETNELPLGSPFLNISFDENENTCRVVGHEGRHRMFWIAKHYGRDTEIPVGLFLREEMYSLKGRHITTEQIERLSEGCYKEKSGIYVEGPIFSKACWVNGNFNRDDPQLASPMKMG